MNQSVATYREFAQQVRAAADIAEVVQQYVELKRAGANLKGLCPFHQEKTPSFNVHPGKQIFKCFGCGKSGDVLTFVREIERADFRQALEILANKYGLELPRFQAKGPDEEQVRRRQGVAAALEEAAHYYQKRLAHPDHGAHARRYLEGRGINPETIEKFRLGVAGEDWTGLTEYLTQKGFSAQCLRDSGLARERKDGKGLNDYLRGRLIFPIANARGEIIGFGGRAFTPEEQPKYLNTPETELFRKGQELYGLAYARDTLTRQGKGGILVEGYVDVIACHQAGLTNAVASMGTSLTLEQARLLRRYTKEVVFLYDGDEAGVQAILRGLAVLVGAELAVRVGLLPAEEDPDSYARKNGPEALGRVAAEAIPFFDFLLAQARIRGDLSTPEGKLHALELFEPVLSAIGEELLYNDYVTQLALVMGHEERALRQYLKKRARPAIRRDTPPPGAAGTAHAGAAKTGAEGAASAAAALIGAGPPSPLERGLLHILMEHGDARDLVRERLKVEWIEHPLVRYWVGRILDLDRETVEVWSALLALCDTPEHEAFLQSVIFSAGESMDNYLSLAEHLVDRLAADYRRNYGRRLNLMIQETSRQSQAGEMWPIIEEQMSNLRTRTEERQRAVSNPCVRVRPHSAHPPAPEGAATT